MPSWSVLRRSPPPIRCMPITQLRHFSHLSGTEVKQDPKSTPISFLKWFGGIITSSTLALAFYTYPSFNCPSLSFSDTSQSLDHHRPKYLFGDAYRRKIFFKYEKRIRMRSPPEKIISPEKTTNEQPMEQMLKLLTTLCQKVESMDEELQQLKKQTSQQHDNKHADLSQQQDLKDADLEGDVEKLHKTQTNEIIIAATEQPSTSKGRTAKPAIIGLQHKAPTGKTVTNQPTKSKNTNLNTLFTKPYTPTISTIQPSVTPQTVTYSESLNQNKMTYTHITRTYIDNLYKLQLYLNQKPRSLTTTNPERDYLTQQNQRHNKLIALPGTNPNLVHTCYNYGLLSTIYTIDGTEIASIPELYKAFTTYKRITKGTLFYIKCYSAPAEISFTTIKPVMQVAKIGLTQHMIIPEEIKAQPEIPKPEIPDFFAHKRVIGLATILQELAHAYTNETPIWLYYSRDQTMIYSHSRDLRQQDMEEIRQWAISLLKPEQIPITRAIKKEFISTEHLAQYCKTIGHKYPDHICSKCHGEDNIIPSFNIEE